MNQSTYRGNPLEVIQQLHQERYPQAQVIFWAGSVTQELGTQASDLDLIVIFEHVPFAYREAFVYQKWPVDVFVNDYQTLHYFLEESRMGSGISGLMYMIMHGKEITIPNSLSVKIKALIYNYFEQGPVLWTQAQIDKERFFITDIFEDIKFASNRSEQIASAARLYEALAQFYFRVHGKWSASGKSIVRYFEKYDQHRAKHFQDAFTAAFEYGQTDKLEKLVHEILQPFGGLLWDGFYSQAPVNARLL